MSHMNLGSRTFRTARKSALPEGLARNTQGKKWQQWREVQVSVGVDCDTRRSDIGAGLHRGHCYRRDHLRDAHRSCQKAIFLKSPCSYSLYSSTIDT